MFYIENEYVYLDEEKKYLIKYLGNEEKLTIPENIHIIGEAAFANCQSLKELSLPLSQNLKEIKALAFFNCFNLKEPNIYNLGIDIATDAFEGCKKSNFVLEEKTIEQIENGNIKEFYIKYYQRGYRWTKNEITELLDDIYELEKNRKYCMQPLTVKLVTMGNCKKTISANEDTNSTAFIDAPVYELVDGQQRLTTLLLILKKCNKKLENKIDIKYKLHYELLRNIDDEYIRRANEIIDEWFEKTKNIDIMEFVDKIRKDLFFIWYEMKNDLDDKGNVEIEDEFRSINHGQIALTNAELFKALLLNEDMLKDIYQETKLNSIKKDLDRIAFEWDQLEQNLRNNEFWFFISNKNCEDKTRLDYLFELYALECKETAFRYLSKEGVNAYKEKNNELSEERDRFSFLVVKNYIDCQVNVYNEKYYDIVEKVWKDIVDIYNKLYTWYFDSDTELYNNIGFLVGCDKKNKTESLVPEIIKLLFKSDNKNKNTDDIKSYVKDQIRKKLNKHFVAEEKESDSKDKTIFSQSYYNDVSSSDIKELLLFFNIWTIANQNGRFPFSKFKNFDGANNDSVNKNVSWDIEHISARNVLADINEEQLKDVMEFWEKEDPENKDWTIKGWKVFADRCSKTPDNSIANLALLDSNTNRSYGNAMFLGKRKEIIERDKENWYIPLCTKNVFLKYYSSKPDYNAAWTESDKDDYLFEIYKCARDGIYNNKNVPEQLLKEIEKLEKSKAGK